MPEAPVTKAGAFQCFAGTGWALTPATATEPMPGHKNENLQLRHFYVGAAVQGTFGPNGSI